MIKKQYNTVIIGAGPAGYVAAIRCAQLGQEVAVVDKWLNGKNPALGGTCLNTGCIPSKALLESSHHYAQLSNLHTHGIQIEKVSLDITALMQRKDAIVKKLTQGIEGLFSHHKIDWLQGTGQLQDERTVSVTENDKKSYTISAENIIIATGSSPVELPIAKFDGQQIIDSADALSLKKVPKKLGIIGAGVIGLELGAVWQRLGAEVTLIEAADTFLPMLDQRQARQARSLVLPKGTHLHLSSKVTAVKKSPKHVAITYRDKQGQSQTLTVDCLLVAVGRRPNTETLTADTCSLEILASGEIAVDEYCQTNLPNVYAIGDTVRGPKLAHKGSKEGIMVAERIAGKTSGINYHCIPSVVYTHPEIATVGYNETQLKADNIEFQTGTANFASNGRALAADAAIGSIKLLTAQKTQRILGAQIIGPNASELIQEIVTVMEFSGTSEDIAAIIHAHPSLAEVTLEAAEDSLGHAIHKATKR